MIKAVDETADLKAHPEVWMEDRHDMVDVAMTDGTSIPIDLALSGRQQCFSLLSLPVSHCISLFQSPRLSLHGDKRYIIRFLHPNNSLSIMVNLCIFYDGYFVVDRKGVW